RRGGQRRQDLRYSVVPERGISRIGRVDEGVAFIKAPPGVDANSLGPARGGYVELHLEGYLESRGDHGRIRIRVVQKCPVAHARQEDGAAPVVRLQILGQS